MFCSAMILGGVYPNNYLLLPNININKCDLNLKNQSNNISNIRLTNQPTTVNNSLHIKNRHFMVKIIDVKYFKQILLHIGY